MGTTTGTGRGRWVVLTRELITTHADAVAAIDDARDTAEQLGCDVIVTDRETGRTLVVSPDGSADTCATRSVRDRAQARRAGVSRA